MNLQRLTYEQQKARIEELEAERDDWKSNLDDTLTTIGLVLSRPEMTLVGVRDLLQNIMDINHDGSDETTAPDDCEYCHGFGYHYCDECIGQGNKPDFSGAPNNPSVCEDCGGTGKQACIICNAESGE